MLVNKFVIMERINKNVFEDLKDNLNLTEEEIIILYVLSCKLQELDNQEDNKPISNSDWAFEHNGEKIINIFDWSLNPRQILPTYFYNLKTRKDFHLLDFIKSVISQDYNGCLSSVEEMENVINGVLIHISIVLNLDYRNNKNKDILISDYLCSSINDFETNTTDKILTTEEKRELYIHLLKNYESFLTKDVSFLESYFVYRYDSDVEKLRVSILDFLEWNENGNGTYLDKDSFDMEFSKASFSDTLFFLLRELYLGICDETDDDEVIILELLKNPSLKSIFFKSLEILLNNPNAEGYRKIIDLI